MKQQGKFILFTVDELEAWLGQNHVNRVIKLIQNHHTYIPAYSHFKGNNHFQLLQSMERSHVVERGFSEIAQNITTFPDGTIALCRSLDKIPAGIKGANQYGICIEHIGCFDTGKDLMRAEHQQAIVALNTMLCRKFNLKPSVDTLVYHHWFDLITGTRRNGKGNTKSCPGTNFFGGNTVTAAELNFIPLIRQALEPELQLPNNVSTTIPALQPLKSMVVMASVLNVRPSHSTSQKALKVLRQGVVLPVYEVSSGWYRIHPVEQQWVYGRYLAEQQA